MSNFSSHNSTQIESNSLSSKLKKRFSFKKPKKGATKEFIGKLSQGLMMPIAVLPIAGLLLGIGAAIVTNAGTNEALKIFGLFLKNAGDFVFGNLSVLFAVAIAIAFTRDAGVAGLSTLIAWIAFNGMQSALIIGGSKDTFGQETYNMLYWTSLPASVFGQNVGIFSLQTSVFGGAIVGSIVAILYNKFYQIRMPQILGFFSGTRFVPIISLLAMVPLSLIFAMIWPGIGLGLNEIGIGLGTLSANGGTNALIFGYIERALVPFGLHHAFYTPLWYTTAGGTMTNAGSITPYIHMNGSVYAVIGYVLNGSEHLLVDDKTWVGVINGLNGNGAFSTDAFAGDQRLWFALNSNLIGKELILSNGEHYERYKMTFETFAQNTWNPNPGAVTTTNEDLLNALNSGTSVPFDATKFTPAFPGVNPGQYEQGKFSFMIFGLPAAAGAMIMAAPKENRKTAFSIVGSAALTSLLTGITEPLEFTFLFLAPWLYWGIHAVLCAFSFWFMSLFGANLGMTFSGGLIDYTIYGIVPDALGANVHSWAVPIIGIVYIPIYFTIFYFLIKRFDLKTPGRGGELISKKKYMASKNSKVDQEFTNTQVIAYKLIDAFGGIKNIEAVNACITKLRVNVIDPSKVDENEIKALGSNGLLSPSPTLVHAIFGTESEPIKTQMNNIIDHRIDSEKLKQYIDQIENGSKDEPIITSDTSSMNTLPNEIIIHAPLSGIVVDSKDIPDKTFAENLMGQGLAIEPDSEKVISPSNKEVKVEVAFPTGHAYILDIDGIKILIHIGLDTVTLNSSTNLDSSNLIAFKPKIKVGDTIKPYADLVDVDFDIIRNKNLKTITPIVVLNECLVNYDLTIIPAFGSHVNFKDPLIKLTLKK
ncbi:PTS transporter subunit IIABC [Mycoplasmoides alvi]|uniref:PTS transporter subunit IIABC n=1 Tax=Mycoplasmoides alvi TaxID=78580 RepID=UPI000697833D|nr:glucose PTS transporter subunit IIA [Mycoplasmoides alvi]